MSHETGQQSESSQMLEIERALRDLTKALVTAAEGVVRETRARPEKSQFAKLAAVCAHAVCTEEIENFIRYQQVRSTSWRKEFADRMISTVQVLVQSLTEVLSSMDEVLQDGARTEAWRRYVVYMSRAHRYQNAIERGVGHDQRRNR